MHPSKISSVLAFLTYTSFFAKAQDVNTIKVQHNPARIDSNIIWCGGIFQRSRLIFELRTLQPIHTSREVFYVPKNYSVNDFIIQNGFGAHIILSNHHAQFNYSRRGSLNLSLVTGFDHFKGKEGDSLIININANQYRYKYSFNMIPINLRLGASLISRPKFFMGLAIDAGEDLLFTNFSWPPNSYKKTNWIADYGGGLCFHFRFGKRSDHVLGLALKAKNLGGNWFREIDLVFPVFYGKYKR